MAVFAGDTKLLGKFRREALLALSSRVRTRLALQSAPAEELRPTLKRLISEAGNPELMTPDLIAPPCEHSSETTGY